MRHATLSALLVVLSAAAAADAQLVPEIGYMHPAGGRAGTTVEVTLGGYDWTPDMQLFPHDPRIKLELLGAPSPVLVPEPPYWFGAKGRGPAWPLPREFRARLTIPAEVQPGIVAWQVANANGASPVGKFQVGDQLEGVDDPAATSTSPPQRLSVLPVIVSGQIRRIEEIDRFEFQAPSAGPITLELFARRLGSPLHGLLQVRDSQGRTVVDAADTEGRDLCVTFVARQNETYVASLHDADFAGDRSYAYRLRIAPGPQAQAAYPAAGRAGETRQVEFVGVGIATGADQIETVTRDVVFPATAAAGSFEYVLDTPHGKSPPLTLAVSGLVESVRAAGAAPHKLADGPSAVTGAIETRFGTSAFVTTWKKGDKWRVAATSTSRTPLDLELTVVGPDGKDVATLDDSPGTTDAILNVVAPTDGEFQILVGDRSGQSGSRAANFRLALEPQREDFTSAIPAVANVPLGATFKLPVKIVREAGWKEPLQLSIAGLPAGVTAPTDLTIPADKNELAIDLTSVADAAVAAQLATITAKTTIGGQPVARELGRTLVAITMKPRIKITPEGLDDVRKVNRGSTYLFPLLIERLEGYTGDIRLEMTAKQQRHRQGLASDEMMVKPGEARVEYPIFVPEWMETTKTSRMILNGAVQIPDPKGNVRTLLQRMELRLGLLPQGALMKLTHGAVGTLKLAPGATAKLPMTLVRTSDFHDAVRVELVLDDRQRGLFDAAPVDLPSDATSAEVTLRAAPQFQGVETLKFRATAMQQGKWKVMSEATVEVEAP